MSHYLLKQGGRVFNALPDTLHMADDVNERTCCGVLQNNCCICCCCCSGLMVTLFPAMSEFHKIQNYSNHDDHWSSADPVDSRP